MWFRLDNQILVEFYWFNIIEVKLSGNGKALQVDGEVLKGETKALRDNGEAFKHGAEALRGKEEALKCDRVH